MKPIRLIHLEGDATERGRQYGSQAAAEIQQNVEDYTALIQHHTGRNRHQVMDEAAHVIRPIIEAHAPDLWLEMQGLAEGAGCSLLDVVLINARSELMSAADECTALAASAEATHHRGVWLAQNWDWYTVVRSDPVLLHIRQPDRPEILTLAEAGQVGKIGMNSAGLGVCLNFLTHRHRGAGLPIHLILRQMLGFADPGRAMQTALSAPRGCAANILLAHRGGEILDLELTPAAADYVYGDAGWLVHTNHLESPRLREGDTGLALSSSSLIRAARARRLVSNAAQERGVTLDAIYAILSDHTYAPSSICRHTDPNDPLLEQSQTRASMVMDLGAGRLWVTGGQPCQAERQLFSFTNG